MTRPAPGPFAVRYYTEDHNPILKGNGFDGLVLGRTLREAEEFVNWVNAALGLYPTPESDSAINSQLENHLESCEYGQLKELELQLELANLEIERLKIDFEKAYSQGCTDTLSFLYGGDSQEKPKA